MYTFQLIALVLVITLYFVVKKVKSKTFKNMYISLVFAIYSIYIILRIMSIPKTLGFISTFVGLILLIAEIMGFLSFIVYILIFKEKYKLEKKDITELKGKLPTVDVLICTYNEDTSLLEKTIQASTRNRISKRQIKHICIR